MLVLVIIRVWPEREVFQTKFEVDALREVFENSSYMGGDLTIEDDDLYALAGYEYLKTGDLTQINVEHPPLGKYVIGLSLKWFNNQVMLQLFFGAWLLSNIFWIAKKHFKSSWWGWLVILGFISDGLFLKNTTHSLLDLMLAVGISSFFLSKKLLVKGLWLGVIASIKYPVTASLVGLSFIMAQRVEGLSFKKSFGNGFKLGLVGLVVFLVSYSPLFIKEGVSGFIKVQERAVRIHLSHVPEYPDGGAVQTMVLNQWPVWFDEVNPTHSVPEWSFIWPVLIVTWLLSPLCFFNKKPLRSSASEWFWFGWIYFMFINSRLFFPNYLFILMPWFYLILVCNFRDIFSKVKR